MVKMFRGKQEINRCLRAQQLKYKTLIINIITLSFSFLIINLTKCVVKALIVGYKNVANYCYMSN